MSGPASCGNCNSAKETAFFNSGRFRGHLWLRPVNVHIRLSGCDGLPCKFHSEVRPPNHASSSGNLADETQSTSLCMGKSLIGPYQETDPQGEWNGKIWIEVNANGVASGTLWLPSSDPGTAEDPQPGIVSRLTETSSSAMSLTLTEDCIMAGSPSGVPTIAWSGIRPDPPGAWKVTFKDVKGRVCATGVGISRQGNLASFKVE